MRLFLGREGGAEMGRDDAEEATCYETAMRHVSNAPVWVKMCRIGVRVDGRDGGCFWPGRHDADGLRSTSIKG